jgi:hypothetical protein
LNGGFEHSLHLRGVSNHVSRLNHLCDGGSVGNRSRDPRRAPWLGLRAVLEERAGGQSTDLSPKSRWPRKDLRRQRVRAW